MDPVTDRHKSVAELLSANRQFARSTASDLEDLLTPELEDGRPLPDLVYLQQLLAAALERRWHRLSAADETFDDARSQRHTLIDERDGDVALLYREVVDLRTVLRGRFGAKPSKRFIGLRGDTSRDPVVIQRQADRAVARLRNLDRPLPASKVRPSGADRIRWANPVAAAADALRATVGRVVDAVKQLDAARLERKRALASFNDAFVGIAGTFEAIYRLTGRDDRAEVVRPSRQHPGRLHREDKKRGRGGSGSRKAPARLLSFKSLRRAWRQLPARRRSG